MPLCLSAGILLICRYNMPAVQLIIQPDATTGKDSWLSSNNPNTNYGTANLLSVGRSGLGDIERAVIQFDLSAIPLSATITSAILAISTSGSPTDFADIYRITSAWNQLTVTWNLMPTFADLINSIGPPYTVDITTAVQNWYDGTWVNYGMIMRIPDEGTAGGFGFYSSDELTPSARPKLTIAYSYPLGNMRSINMVEQFHV